MLGKEPLYPTNFVCEFLRPGKITSFFFFFFLKFPPGQRYKSWKKKPGERAFIKVRVSLKMQLGEQ